MANPEQLKIIRKGTDTWNKWRQQNPDIKINLSGADLSKADLSGAILSNIKLSGADLSNIKLSNIKLSRKKLSGADLSKANLSGADLSGANLSGADLSEANLSEADLSEANLSEAIITATQTLYTDFNNANLTGACIQDWNINHQTNLNNVSRDYIFLKQKWNDKTQKYDFLERRPQDHNKKFNPGESTKLFKKALETVDLIFSEGIDWKAFLTSFEKLQIECGSHELSIHSFENKDDGAFVIRVNVPTAAEKAEIKKYLKRQYQLEAQIEAQSKRLANLQEITKLLASRHIKITNTAKDRPLAK